MGSALISLYVGNSMEIVDKVVGVMDVVEFLFLFMKNVYAFVLCSRWL